MTKTQIETVAKLKREGKVEGIDFRVVWFGIQAEIKYL